MLDYFAGAQTQQSKYQHKQRNMRRQKGLVTFKSFGKTMALLDSRKYKPLTHYPDSTTILIYIKVVIGATCPKLMIKWFLFVV